MTASVTVASTLTDSGAASSQRTERRAGCWAIFSSMRGRSHDSSPYSSTKKASRVALRVGRSRK